jgi:hypothetical protein
MCVLTNYSNRIASLRLSTRCQTNAWGALSALLEHAGKVHAAQANFMLKLACARRLSTLVEPLVALISFRHHSAIRI